MPLMELKDGKETFAAKDAKEWRRWLMKNHEKKKSVWLIIYHKKSDVKSVYYDEAVEQALCFGWIDSKPNKRDDQSYYLYFSRRNPKSFWSKANRERIEKLSKKGLIMPAGQKLIDLAKESGTWLALVDIENLIIPDDLQKLFDKNKKAFENFKAFPRSAQMGILGGILLAKRPETRAKRIKAAVELAEKNIRANQQKK